MSIVDNVKEIADLVKKLNDVELYRRIVELEAEVMDLTRENRTFKEQLELAGKMSFKKPFWYKEGDEIPHCPRCWEGDKKTIHLMGPIMIDLGRRYNCPQCKQVYDPDYQGQRRFS